MDGEIVATEAPTAPILARRWRVSPLELLVALAVAIAFADSSIVVLALPELYGELSTSITGISWVITAYNLAVVVGVLALLPFERRLRPSVVAICGLTLFFASSVACAVADGLVWLIAARTAQGLGAALLMVASLPVLVALSGRRHRAVAIWVGAGTFGAALGPALGGLLTWAFSWRAIFAVQAPVAAAALAGALDRRARAARPARATGPRPPLAAGLGLGLSFAALVGALFLAVLLVVTVWTFGPLAGALVVSVLPLAAVATSPLSAYLRGAEDVAAGCALLAAGLTALALLPASSAAYAVPALALAGAGLGLALPPLTRRSLSEVGDLARSAVYSVGVRHAGLVVGLIVVAPLLASALDETGQKATVAGTAAVLDAPIPLTKKVPIALDLYDGFQQAKEGEIPNLDRPFDERGGADDSKLRQARDTLREAVEAPLTRAFRPAFLVSALFALLACATALALRRRRA
jgi:MFS family permease